MSKIAKFYENLQKSFKPKDTKKTAQKATSVFLASLLTITYISSSRFNENAQIEAAAKWLTGIENETPVNLIATLEGEYDPAHPQRSISINSDDGYTLEQGDGEKNLIDSEGNITLPAGTYKCKNFKIGTTARFKIKSPQNDGETADVTIWLEGDNKFEGVNGANRPGEDVTTDNNKNKFGGGASGGTAGICLPENVNLYLRGSGSITAQGGNGANGENASNGCFIDLYKKCSNNKGSGYEEGNYNLNKISNLLYYDMNTSSSEVGTIGGLNTGAGTGAGGSGGGGGGSAIGTDGSTGGKGGKGFETYDDLNAACSTNLANWLEQQDTSVIQINNTEGDGAHSKNVANSGSVYFLNTGKITLTEGKGGEGGRAGQGMPNRNVTEKYRILGGGYGNFNNGRNTDDYDHYYLERIGGLKLLLGGGGGGGGNGTDGKKVGSGGPGGGGGGAGGLGAAEYHIGLAENNYYSDNKLKKICSNTRPSSINYMNNYCPNHKDNNLYGHGYGPLVFHFNKSGDDGKAYTPFSCNGGGGGGGGGGAGVGGGGAGGYINYISRRESFESIIPQGDYLNRTTHCSAYWTWRSNHYKDFAPNWGMGGDPYDNSSVSYRTAPSPYVTTTNANSSNIVKSRELDKWASGPLLFVSSANNSITSSFDSGLVDNKNLYYVRNDNYVYYNGYYEQADGKVCKISNNSGKDGGNAVCRYRTYVTGNVGTKECSCYYNKNPIYPTAWGGGAGKSGEIQKAGNGGSAKNVASFNSHYYNQEWRIYDDGNGAHSIGPGARHQNIDGRDLVGVGCSAEGFDGSKGGDKANEGNDGGVYYSNDAEFKEGNEILDISKIVLEMYMSGSDFTLRTNQKLTGPQSLNKMYWTVNGTKIEGSDGVSQIPFKEDYFGKEIGICYEPVIKKTQEDGTETAEKYKANNIYFGNGTEAEAKKALCKYSQDEETGTNLFDSITIKYVFNFTFKECDWSQTNDLIAAKEDEAAAPDGNVYPYLEAKYNSGAIVPELEVLFGSTKLVEGKHFYLNFYLAKTSQDNTTWQKVDPKNTTAEQDAIEPIASTSVQNNGENITTAGSKLNDMSQYSKTPTSSMGIGDRIVVEFVPKNGFPENEKNSPQILFTYRIVQTDLSQNEISVSLSPDTIVYDGKNHNNDIEKSKFDIGVYVRNIFRNLNKDEFEITWPDGDYTNVGTYTLKVAPKTSTGFKGETETNFKIVPYDIGCENTAYKLELNQTEFDFVNSIYSKDWPKPTVNVVKSDNVSQEVYDELGMNKNGADPGDYVVEYYDVNEDGSYSSNLTKKAGKKVVMVKGRNPYSYDKESTENSDCNFTGTLTAIYNINGTNIDDGGISISLHPESFTYNGEEQKPEIIITKEKNGTTTSLKEGEDYTILWEENGDYTNAGTKKMSVKGIGENGFTGEKEITYDISAVEYSPSSDDWEMTITPDNFYYNGTKLVPKVSVKHKGNTLEENKDYILEYSDDSIDAGDKIITVKLKGNYSGQKELRYKIYNVSYDATYGDGMSISLSEILSQDYSLSSANLVVDSIASSEKISEGTDLNQHIFTEGTNLKVGLAAPAGNYVVSIKDKNNTIFPFYVNLSIAKASPQLTIKDKTASYTGSEITVDEITLKFKNDENFGEIKDIVSFDYYTDAECTSLVKGAPVTAGTYYAKAYVKAPNGNYNSITSNVATLTIQKAKQNLTGSKSYSGYPGSSAQIDTKTDADTKLTYKSADENIVQIDSQGKMLLMKDGTTTVTTTAEETENYESATFESTVVVDKTLNSITAGDKIIDNEIENNGSAGTSSGRSGGSSNSSSSSSNSSKGNSAGNNSNSNAGGSSQNGTSSESENSSNSAQKEDEEKESLPLVADKFWGTILSTGDKSVYIISIAVVAIAIALTILIVLKRKEKDE